jgi:Holliday junction resolvase RusA-like endonuclease
MTEINIVLSGEPVAKARPRFSKGRKGVAIYNPERTVNYEVMLRYAAQQAMSGNPPLEVPISIDIEASFRIPKSVNKKTEEMMQTGRYPVLKKPDIDNLQKSAFDALNGVVYRDDSLIWNVTARKVYSQNPSIKIKITPMSIEDVISSTKP